jgi:hypothetical protein
MFQVLGVSGGGGNFSVTYIPNWPGGIAGSGSVPVNSNMYANGAVVPVAANSGGLAKAGYNVLGWATSSSASSPMFVISGSTVTPSTFTMGSANVTLYAVWGSIVGTIVVPYNGRLAGDGSKQNTYKYNSGYPTIISVQSNLPNNLSSSAVIENLIIDGLNLSNNATGILLENVYNCLIRNLTIMNCEVGIRVKLTGSNWSHANRFEHIRMINVKTGILFEGTNSANDFAYTTIDSVGISLAGNSTDVGIKVGNGNAYANLYSSFIKATVWLDTSGGKGLEVNGALKFSLVNFEVEQKKNDSGRGVVINSGATVYDNQSFLLTALGYESPIVKINRVVNNGNYDGGITIVPP